MSGLQKLLFIKIPFIRISYIILLTSLTTFLLSLPIYLILNIPVYTMLLAVLISGIAIAAGSYFGVTKPMRSFIKEVNKYVDGLLKGENTKFEFYPKIYHPKEIAELNTAFKIVIGKIENAYKELRELDRFKSNIISNVSHELKTPITIAKGAIDLALEEKDVEKIRNHLIFAKRNLLRLLNIIDDLITIAKIEKKGLMLEYEKVNMMDIIEDVVNEKIDFAEKQKVKIILDVEDFDFYADKFELKHALLNLIDNAIKFNKENGKVFIKAYKGNDFAVIKVKDTGIGIPKDKLDKIFEPFFQGDPSPTRRYGGTGLGLTIVKRVIELHRGRISVESEEGKGTEFTIKLPLLPV